MYGCSANIVKPFWKSFSIYRPAPTNFFLKTRRGALKNGTICSQTVSQTIASFHVPPEPFRRRNWTSCTNSCTKSLINKHNVRKFRIGHDFTGCLHWIFEIAVFKLTPGGENFVARLRGLRASIECWETEMHYAWTECSCSRLLLFLVMVCSINTALFSVLILYFWFSIDTC